jgi:hypothetical protein
MDIIGSIVRHGTEAVLEYRRMNGIETDERVPEVFLGGQIALGVHRETGLNAHVERYYTTIATELGRQRDVELVNSLGGWRADVALYDGRTPKGVVEIKKYAEGGGDPLVRRDLEKLRSLARNTPLDVFVAVLVTDTVRHRAEERVTRLGELLGGRFDVLSPSQVANEGAADWSWMFVCGSFT